MKLLEMQGIHKSFGGLSVLKGIDLCVEEGEVVGVVDAWQDGLAACTQRGKFCLGDELEALQPSGEVVTFCPQAIYGQEGEAITATPHPMMRFAVPCETQLAPYSILRRRARKG